MISVYEGFVINCSQGSTPLLSPFFFPILFSNLNHSTASIAGPERFFYIANSNLVRAEPEDALSAALLEFEAAGVRHRQLATDGGRPVVVVAGQEVEASAAVESPLEVIPLGRDGWVDAVQLQVFVDFSGVDSGPLNDGPELQRGEDGAQLCQEGDGQKDGVQPDEDGLLCAADGEPEQAGGGAKKLA